MSTGNRNVLLNKLPNGYSFFYKYAILIIMNKKSIFQRLNIFAQCREEEIPLRQCPQFLFLIMGIVIIGSILLIYMIGIEYIIDPFFIILIVLSITIILFVIAFIITHSFGKLAEANRMKTEFLNIVSHQLRAPLTSLRWTIELLIEEKSTIRKQEYFQILKKNSNQMQNLINDLLIVSRITQGTFPLRKKEVDFGVFIEDVISQFNFFAQSSNVKIKVKKQEKLPKVFIDSSQIKIVVENLIENAIRYSKKKGEIKISWEKKGNKTMACPEGKHSRFLSEAKGSYIYFEVKDKGIGIPEQDKKHIFKKFFRAKNVLEHQDKGSGLGLFISKLIIKASGGEIDFVSQENIGSTFWFTLPISKS